jgi:hypothetical protein
MSCKWNFTTGEKIAYTHIGHIRGAKKCAFNQRRFAHESQTGFIVKMRRVVNDGASIAAKGTIRERIDPMDNKISHQCTA